MSDEKKLRMYILQCPSCAATLPQPGFNGLTTCKFCQQVVKVNEPGSVPMQGTISPYQYGTAEFYPNVDYFGSTAGTAIPHQWSRGRWTTGT